MPEISGPQNAIIVGTNNVQIVVNITVEQRELVEWVKTQLKRGSAIPIALNVASLEDQLTGQPLTVIPLRELSVPQLEPVALCVSGIVVTRGPLP